MNVIFEQHSGTFVSRDLQESVTFLTSLFVPHILRKTSTDPLLTQVDYIQLHHCMIAISSYNAAIDIEPDNMADVFQIKIPLEGQFQVLNNGLYLTVTKGQGAIVIPTDKLCYKLAVGTKCLTISVDREHVISRMAKLWGADAKEGYNFSSVFLLSEPDGHIWVQNLAQIWNQISLIKEAKRPFSDILKRSYSNLIIDSFLHLRVDKDVPFGQAANFPIPRILRTATNIIENGLDTPLRLEEIAKTTGVSVRTLQMKFKQYFGSSPQTYIKRQRLNRAHRALIRAERSDSVTDIAYQCGIVHLGRFSKEYREIYGCRPSDTLQMTK